MRNLAWHPWLTLAVTISLFVVGCGQKSTTNPAITPAPPVPTNFGPAPTEEDCREFGKQLEAAVASGDRSAVERLYRLDSLAERCVSDLNLSASFRRSFLAGFKRSGGGLVDQIINTVRKGGKFTPLRVRTVDGCPRLIMRLLPEDGGINYQEFTLARYPDGTIAAEDFHMMLAGEKMSQLIRRIILQAAAESNRGLLTNLKGAERVFTQNLPRIQAMVHAVKQGQHKEALATYHQLPAELQKDKVVLLVVLNAAQGISDEEYLRLLERFRQNHPDDPAIDLVSIDYYLLKKEYEEALQCLARLDKAVGGDPYLLVLRGNALSEAGRFADAKAALEKAIEQEPKLEQAYWTRITISLKEKNHADTLAWLKKVVEQCAATIDEEALKKDDNYAAFVKSPQFNAFQKWYPARGK